MESWKESTQNNMHGVSEFRFQEFKFCWEVRKFAQIPQDAIVKSPIFEGGSTKWQLEMTPTSKYPNTFWDIYGEGSGIAFSIVPIGAPPKDCRARPQLVMLNNQDRSYNPCYPAISAERYKYFKMEEIGQFKLYFPKCGWIDIVRIICTIEVYDPEMVKSAIVSKSSKDGLTSTLNDKFLQDWTRLFQSMDNADISINVGGEILKAHKAILSIRSPVFERMFGIEMKESLENEIQIDDFELGDVNALLEFIYTGQTEAIKTNPEDLIQLAEKYELEDMKSACGDQLSKGITLENAIERFYLADRTNLTNLNTFVEAFIIRNKKEMVKTQAFKDLAESGRFLELFANIIAQD